MNFKLRDHALIRAALVLIGGAGLAGLRLCPGWSVQLAGARSTAPSGMVWVPV